MQNDLTHDIYLVKRVFHHTSNTHNGMPTSGNFYIMSKWPKANSIQNVQLVLQTHIDGKCYSGYVSIKDMQDAADELNMSHMQFISECRMVLSVNDASDMLGVYEFGLEHNLQKPYFTLKKLQTKLRICYMEVSLQEQRDSTAMLDALVPLVQNMSNIQAPPALMQTLPKSLLDDATLHQCLQAQQKIEQELMSKFCILLNSKKQKINDLQGQLDSLKVTHNLQENKTNSDNDDTVYDEDTQPMQLTQQHNTT